MYYKHCGKELAAAFLLVTIFILPPLAIGRGASLPIWPKNQGVYISPSSETIPPFSRALIGFRSEEDNEDFWGHTFACRGSVRVFGGAGWTGVPNFPATMNGCSSGVFMIRWRAASPDMRIESSLGYYDLTVGPARKPKLGAFGYMYGTNCEQPMFKFVGTLNRNDSTLVDVYYELKFWQAAP